VLLALEKGKKEEAGLNVHEAITYISGGDARRPYSSEQRAD